MADEPDVPANRRAFPPVFPRTRVHHPTLAREWYAPCLCIGDACIRVRGNWTSSSKPGARSSPSLGGVSMQASVPRSGRPLVLVTLDDRGVRRLLAYALGRDAIDVIECDDAELQRRLRGCPDVLDRIDAIVMDADASPRTMRWVCDATPMPRPPLVLVRPVRPRRDARDARDAEERAWDRELEVERFVVLASDLGHMVRRVRCLSSMARRGREHLLPAARERVVGGAATDRVHGRIARCREPAGTSAETWATGPANGRWANGR